MLGTGGKLMPKTKKEKWIEKEDKKLLDRHHANLEFIEHKEGEIKHCLHRIGLLHRSVFTLAGQYSYFNGAVTFDEQDTELIAQCTGENEADYPQNTIACQLKFGIEILEKEQEIYALRVAVARKDIEAVGGDAVGSFQIYEKESKALPKKYDELFKKGGN